MVFKEKIRPIIGVISTQTTDTEQRRFLSGITEEAAQLGFDVAVISNVFNPFKPSDSFSTENRIYDLLDSTDYDGFILLLESFVNDSLPGIILKKLAAQKDKPVVAVGTPHSGFTRPGFIHINTDDIQDFESITDHLIDVHGFRNIDFLSGKIDINVSHLRIEGYRRSLEKHGIPYRDEKVFFGSFWFDSGKAHAQRYITGELPLPEAIICANDYMAYGMLDEFLENNIRVPRDVTVVGFENVGSRRSHSPMLTTYLRSRTELGRKSVRIIYSELTGTELPDNISLTGTLLPGNSCPCGIPTDQLLTELRIARTHQENVQLNLFSLMDHRLTECVSIPDFISVLKKYTFLIRDVDELYLCLLEKWFDDRAESELLNCFPVIGSGKNEPSSVMERLNLAALFAQNNEPAAYYFSPIFFSERYMGHTVLRYDHPDDYDYLFRSWLKSVSNALELLRMKNDISYLTQCRNISDIYDSLTGLYNVTGFENAVSYTVSSAGENDRMLLIIAKTELIPSEIQFDRQDVRISISKKIAAAVMELEQTRKVICGRINSSIYACAIIGDITEEYARMLTDKLRVLIIHKTGYVSEYGLGSFICFHRSFDSLDQFSFKTVTAGINEMISGITSRVMQKKSALQYREFSQMRDRLYLDPEHCSDPEPICRRFDIGIGHFRHIYKNLFDISFNQDCIAARMYLAQYKLLTTSDSINDIAESCGYFDEKYFMRLFRKHTGCTAVQYRELLHVKDDQ